jgi:UDP-N-acetylglucosamine 4,6-dehydratase
MSVVIFGGTGSLGTHLVKHFTTAGEKVIVVSRDEQKQFVMKEKFPQVTFLLGDVRSLDDLRNAFRDSSVSHITPELVINAAALKHVTLGEYNPYQSVQTNILGVKNIIDVCREFSVPTCVFVSTDKAAHPVNLYGMCKAVAERLFIQANKTGSTKFVGVRYGNVVNSNGSLIPFLQRRVQEKKSLLLTSNEMTRFFITLDQAINVIDWARADETFAGTITVPKLASARIVDIVELYSMKYHLPVEIVGIRPGEKLHETLITREELSRIDECKEYYRIYDPTIESGLPRYKSLHEPYTSEDNLMSKKQVEKFLEGQKLL